MDSEERKTRLVHLADCKVQAEKAYDEMYDAHSFRDANLCYRDAKEFFASAIRQAEALGMPDEAEALRKRLEDIKAVFRSQFVQ